MVCWTTARCFSKDGSKTLCRPPIDRLSVLRLDGDMYESTVQALDTLYDKVSPGGFVIDDYILKSCAQTVDHFS
jgi:O-methyltransferase